MSTYAAILYAKRHFKIFFQDPHVINTRYDEPDLENMESGLPVYREDPVEPVVPAVSSVSVVSTNPAEKEDLENPETSASVHVNVPESQERPKGWISKVFSAVSSVFVWRK